MDQLYLTLENAEDQNPCTFSCHLTHPLDLREGRWFLALLELEKNFELPGQGFVFISLNILDSSQYLDDSFQILRVIDRKTDSVFYSSGQKLFKTCNPGKFRSVRVRLRGQEGNTLRLSSKQRAGASLRLVLELVHVQQQQDLEEDTTSDSDLSSLVT